MTANVVAIVQARMSSSRLAGKVLLDIAGKPVLWHVIHRLKKSQHITKIVLATTKEPCDDVLETFANEHGISIVRGPRDNVLERFILAAHKYHADYIVRVTGDAPLVDPAVIDTMVMALINDHADICDGGAQGPYVIHEGFTPLSRKAFDDLARFGGDDPAVQEHVTVKLDQYVQNIKSANIKFDADDVFTGARLSVDTPADLQFQNTLYDLLNAAPGEADIKDVVRLLKARPDLLDISTHVHQKSMDEASHDLVIRCDGGKTMGMGHVMRCLSLAIVLRDHFATGVRFLIADTPDKDKNTALDLIQNHHFCVDVIPDNKPETDCLNALFADRRVDGIVFDIRTDLSADYILDVRNKGALTVCIDDPSDRRLACDLGFYPPVPQIKTMSWDTFQGTLHVGWEWVLLNPSFLQPIESPSSTQGPLTKDPLRILVTMGGADPTGMIDTVLHSLENIKGSVEIDIVIGPAFQGSAGFKARLQTLNSPYTLHHNVENMAALMATANMAIAAFGVTAYELIASGVPTILLCATEDHATASEAFVKANVAVSLGVVSGTDQARLSTSIQSLIDDTKRRQSMAQRAQSLDLKNGAFAVAREIKKALTNRTAP